MQSNLAKNIEKIFSELYKVNSFAKNLIKYGTLASLTLLTLGTIFLIVNHTVFNLDPYYEFIATSIVKTSFTILAEVIIGGLLIDYIFKR